MDETYTIQSVMATGKSDPTYGTEYYVKFAESEQTFQMWYKTAPTEGQKQDGHIEGNKFKKAKKEWNPGGPSSGITRSSDQPKRPAYKDNSDGQRQGMAINNAAAYVMATAEKPLNPSEWAQAVKAYAKALYDASDLTEQVEVTVTAEPTVEAPKNVQEIFGVKKAIPANK